MTPVPPGSTSHAGARVPWRLRQLDIRRCHWSAPIDRPAAGWHSLAGTEQAVAYLVAEGLNDNQVAAHMYISTHTVAHHLRQAFRKPSITSRVELARIVIEQAADGASQRTSHFDDVSVGRRPG